MGVLVRLGLALPVSACSATLDPLSERCIQALEYLEPEHGDIEARESYASGGGTVIAIRYSQESASGSELSRTMICEFGAGERWNFEGIGLQERDLSEMELTLVNAEFLLRDLDRHPERLSGRPAAGRAPVRLEVAVGAERGDIPVDSGFSGNWSIPSVELNR